jgi:hypothetical protein
MSDLTTIIDTHLEAYGEPDEARRMTLIEKVWAPDGVLLDPPLDGTGHDGISAAAAAVNQHYPGHRFRRTTAIDEHHDVARYGWELVGRDGAVAIAGVDVVEVRDGQLQRVAGFFGELPPPKDD